MEAAPKAERKRRDGEKPDQETSAKSKHEMGILPLLRNIRNTHKKGRHHTKRSDQPNGRAPDHFKAARNRL